MYVEARSDTGQIIDADANFKGEGFVHLRRQEDFSYVLTVNEKNTVTRFSISATGGLVVIKEIPVPDAPPFRNHKR